MELRRKYRRGNQTKKSGKKKGRVRSYQQTQREQDENTKPHGLAQRIRVNLSLTSLSYQLSIYKYAAARKATRQLGQKYLELGLERQ